MGYWGWRPLISTLFICVWITGCNLLTRTAPVTSPTQLPRITLTLRVRETKTPLPTPTPPAFPTHQTETYPADGVYIVRPGDTLLGIALDTGLDVEQIRAANPDINPLALQVGQQIVLPPPGLLIAAAPTPVPLQPEAPDCHDLITGSLLCLGQVVNLHDAPVTDVQVRVRLVDAGGALLAEKTARIEQAVIPPGQSAPYSAMFQVAGEVHAQAALLTAAPVTAGDWVLLDVIEPQTETTKGRCRIRAMLQNTTGTTTGPPRLVLTLLDDEGRVVGFRIVTGTAGLEPDAQQPIELEAMAAVTSAPATCRLHAEALQR